MLLAFSDAICWSDIYRALNVSVSTHNKRSIVSFATLHNIPVPMFTYDTIKTAFRRGKPNWNLQDIFCVDSKFPRAAIRKAVIRHRVLPDPKCSECGCGDKWNNKPLTIELDHINGISSDNRITNLRWLCPNCHTQTVTHKGKNRQRAL